MGILQGDLKAAGPGHTEGTLRKAEVKAMVTGEAMKGRQMAQTSQSPCTHPQLPQAPAHRLLSCDC